MNQSVCWLRKICMHGAKWDSPFIWTSVCAPRQTTANNCVEQSVKCIQTCQNGKWFSASLSFPLDFGQPHSSPVLPSDNSWMLFPALYDKSDIGTHGHHLRAHETRIPLFMQMSMRTLERVVHSSACCECTAPVGWHIAFTWITACFNLGCRWIPPWPQWTLVLHALPTEEAVFAFTHRWYTEGLGRPNEEDNMFEAPCKFLELNSMTSKHFKSLMSQQAQWVVPGSAHHSSVVLGLEFYQQSSNCQSCNHNSQQTSGIVQRDEWTKLQACSPWVECLLLPN